ncbi:hypothetical protein HIM_02467 [Hirsutella minnesotensis 3608]|nr:hypothetical protein HIM_02467 [Hirsutella minnesotensis 3608]
MRGLQPVDGEEHKQPNDKNAPYFRLVEHALIGDAGAKKAADAGDIFKMPQLTLSKGAKLSYGEISALAGDFYGTMNAISDGVSPEERAQNFERAFRTLDGSSADAVKNILDHVKSRENQVIEEAIKKGREPSSGLSELGLSDELGFNKLTKGRDPIPSYWTLAEINWDHFGEDARTAYKTGHRMAIDFALKAENRKSAKNLYKAYAINAFADHFLHDCFSSGHLRVPRRALSGSWRANWLSKLMHDEDSALGLEVENIRGDKWKAYGDSYRLDKVNARNLELCEEAVAKSIQEVFEAWEKGTDVKDDDFGALRIAPTLMSANRESQALAPLFSPPDWPFDRLHRRATIAERGVHRYTNTWWLGQTLWAIQLSGMWNYPMTMGSSKSS